MRLDKKQLMKQHNRQHKMWLKKQRKMLRQPPLLLPQH